MDVVNDEAFRRVVGARPRSVPGETPDEVARRALTKLARDRTGAPKGVFRYRSHEEANAHRDAWTVQHLVGGGASPDSAPSPPT